MNSRIYWVISLTIGSMVCLPGCAQNRVSLVSDNKVSVERASTRHVYFPWVDVCRENGTSLVSGTIRQRQLHRHPMSGHIDVLLIAPDGRVIEQSQAAIHPHRHSRRGPKEAHFKVRLKTAPPSGAVVRVKHHRESHPPTGGEHSSTKRYGPLFLC